MSGLNQHRTKDVHVKAKAEAEHALTSQGLWGREAAADSEL